MTPPRETVRVLQLLADTDASEANRAALALHRDLAGSGLEVRTLALAPGARGGLDDAVPVLAPTRRSFTLRRVVDREARWADVVVLHGDRALIRHTRRRAGRPPVVLVATPPGDGSGATVKGVDVSTTLEDPCDTQTWVDLLSACADRSC